MQVQKFKKVTEAMQFDGTQDSADKIALWLSTFCFYPARFDRRGGVASLDIDGQLMVEGDYVIRSMKDYPYVIPLADFLVTYQPDDLFVASCNLGTAIIAARGGAKVTRKAWGQDAGWVVYMDGLQLPPASTTEPGPKVNERTARHIGRDTPLNSQPYLALGNAHGLWQPGWTASTQDLLAQDWTIVEEEN